MATGPVVDQLAGEYAAAHQPVVFIEQNVDSPLGNRINRWWAAHGSGSVFLPLSMVDSGNQLSNGYLGASAHDTYQAMVDTALARPPQAEITAYSRRVGNHFHFDIQLTNLSGVTLSSSNAAAVHAIVYEEHTPVDPTTDHITGRIVRAAVSTNIAPGLAPNATMTLTLETGDLDNVVDWAKLHAIVLADYRPGTTSGAYDMLQAAYADAIPALTVTKQAMSDRVQPGDPLTYTIRIANTGDLDLHATVTDTLPAHVSPAGVLTWSPTITAPGGIWERTVVVTVEVGYTGALVNRVLVTTQEGASGEAVSIVNGSKVFLPIAIKD
jgi:uncharacterized repeat protein (TIGR01451 family)